MQVDAAHVEPVGFPAEFKRVEALLELDGIGLRLNPVLIAAGVIFN